MAKAKSLINRFLTIVAISMLFNLVFSLGLIFFTGTFNRMKMESYEEFAARVLYDAANFNKVLDSYSVSATLMANNVDERLKSMALRYGIAPGDLHRSADEAAVTAAFTNILTWFDTTEVNGAYFLLCNPDDLSDNPGFFVNLSTTGASYICEAGPASLLDRQGVAVGNNWSERLKLDPGGVDGKFVQRLLRRRYVSDVAFREDGYWASPHNVLGFVDRGVSYSVPLLDDDYRVYAILGIVLDDSLVVRRLANPSGDKFQTSYALVPLDAKETPPRWLLSNGSVTRDVWLKHIASGPLETHILRGSSMMVGDFEVPTDGGTTVYSAIFRNLDIYPHLSPYRDEGWALAGFAERAKVVRSYRNALALTIASIALSVVIAGVLIFVLTRGHLRQISTFSNAATGAEDGAIELGKTNIAEIDHIAGVLENMQKSVTESALRVATIFDLLEMPMGSFEVRDGTDSKVFVTPSLKKILELRGLDDSMYISAEQWREIYARLKAYPFEDEDNVYSWYSDDDSASMKLIKLEEVRRYDATIGIITDVTDHLRRNMELEFQANYDSLTRLYNRRLFKRKVIKRIRSEPGSYGLMLFGDLDGLKQVNDVYGHACGDLLIKTAADVMSTLQPIGGITSRLSGDEFAAYVHGFESKEEALDVLMKHMAEHFNKTIELTERVERHVSMSRGIACYPSDSADFSNLLAFADYAMYQAKHSNKGSVRVFDRADYLNDAVLKAKNDALVEIVEQGKLSYVFQPVYDIVGEDISGYGVFMRPQIEEFKDPRSLLDIAVITDKQALLENRIFRDVLSWMKKDAMPPETRICIKTIKNYVPDEESLRGLREEFGECFHRLVVLISADSALDNEVTDRKVRAYRDAGALIAFEGFGDSLAESLDMIKMEPDRVKINVSLIRDAAVRPDSHLKLSRIVSECAKREIGLIAMEIETSRDFELAKKMGFDYAQGYYIGYPAEKLAAPGFRLKG